MSPGPNGQPSPYRVSIPKKVADQLKTLGRQAREEGWFPQYQAALLEIDRRLRSDPLGFGELVNELLPLKLIIHVRPVPPLVVRFAIHQELRIAILMSVSRVTP